MERYVYCKGVRTNRVSKGAIIGVRRCKNWLSGSILPDCLASLTALIDSVTEPIWFTFNKRALHAPILAAFSIRIGLVTVKSSPTICTSFPTSLVKAVQPSQSSSSNPSSIDLIGNSLHNSYHIIAKRVTRKDCREENR